MRTCFLNSARSGADESLTGVLCICTNVAAVLGVYRESACRSVQVLKRVDRQRRVCSTLTGQLTSSHNLRCFIFTVSAPSLAATRCSPAPRISCQALSLSISASLISLANQTVHKYFVMPATIPPDRFQSADGRIRNAEDVLIVSLLTEVRAVGSRHRESSTPRGEDRGHTAKG